MDMIGYASYNQIKELTIVNLGTDNDPGCNVPICADSGLARTLQRSPAECCTYIEKVFGGFYETPGFSVCVRISMTAGNRAVNSAHFDRADNHCTRFHENGAILEVSNFSWLLELLNLEYTGQKRELSGPRPLRGVRVDSSKSTIWNTQVSIV